MAIEPFRFTLQPELVARQAEKEGLERDLAALIAERDRLRAVVADVRARIEETTQRIRAERDKQTSPDGPTGQLSADTWIERSRFIEELTEYQERQRRELDAEDRAARLAEHKLRAKEEELGELASRVDALERAKAEQLLDYKKQVERLAEKRRDEDALLRWNHQKRNEP